MGINKLFAEKRETTLNIVVKLFIYIIKLTTKIELASMNRFSGRTRSTLTVPVRATSVSLVIFS